MSRKMELAVAHRGRYLLRRCVTSWWASTVSNRLHCRKMDDRFASVKHRVVEYLMDKEEPLLPEESKRERLDQVKEVAIQTSSGVQNTETHKVGGAKSGMWLKARNHVVGVMFVIFF